MTNLSGDSKQPRFSRERILVGVPCLGGLVIAGCLGWFVVRPDLDQMASLQSRLEELQLMQQQLPGLNRKVADAEQALGKAQDQQALLVDLIAGQDRIQTFLALLNQVARRTQVSITRYEPLASSPPPTPEASRRQSRTTKKQQKPVDPLQSLGYRKTAVALNVTGPYTGLQRFLQQMEALEVMVESSELNLQASNSRDADSPQASAALKTDLKLKLSFYDRISPSKESNATTRAKSAPV